MIFSLFKLYGITLFTCLLIDVTWISTIAQKFYQKHLGFLLNNSFNIYVGLLFYALFSAALIIFVILPAHEKSSLGKAFLLGFLFGLVTYSAYDLTNQATIKNWPIIVTVVDMLWGACMASLTAGISYYISTKLGII